MTSPGVDVRANRVAAALKRCSRMRFVPPGEVQRLTSTFASCTTNSRPLRSRVYAAVMLRLPWAFSVGLLHGEETFSGATDPAGFEAFERILARRRPSTRHPIELDILCLKAKGAK